MPGIVPLNGCVLEVLAPGDIERIHAASLELLGRVGMVFEDEAAVALLQAHGARADGDRVCLPARLVEDALASCPRYFTLPAREPAKSIELGLGRVHFTNGYGAPFVRDLETSAPRQAALADVRQLTLLADALDCVHYCLLPVIPQDLPPEKADLAAIAIMLAATDKHVGASLPTVRFLPTLIELARLAAGDGQPLTISLGATTRSPLQLSGDSIARLQLAAKHGIPFRIVSGAIAGITAPATLAGALVVQNAEVLGGLTLGQLLHPGLPLIYGTFTAAGDMRSAKMADGGPEAALLNAASAQLCRRYGVPLGYGSGGSTDSPQGDMQAGAEKMLTALWAAAAGVEVIHGAAGGLLGGALVASPLQMVIDDELCRLIARAIQGIEVSPETLAVDLIAKVGPGGNYLAEDHTVLHWRREHFLPRLLNRSNPTSNAREASMEARACERARELIASHRPNTVDRATLTRMGHVLESVGVSVAL